MAQKVRDVMTPTPVAVVPSQAVSEAARAMRDYGIGAVLVVDNDQLKGIASDRDIVIRAIAAGKDPDRTPVSEVCSADLITITPDEDAETAVLQMRQRGVRRMPVVDDRRHPVGMLSIGDLAIARDERSALADISAQPPNS